jgi:hypothetical protein
VTTAADIIRVAKSQVGTQETRTGGHWVNNSVYNRWYGKIPGYDQGGYGYPWCAVFVAWVAEKAGVSGLYPKTAGCATAVAWFKSRSRFSEYPAVGGQVFFGPGGGTHTGLVYAYDATYIYTIEGNTNTSGSAEGDGVYLKKRARRDSYVYGYGYPSFAAGIVSADPKWAAKTPAKTNSGSPAKTPLPVVDLSQLVAAARTDPGAAQGHVTYRAGTNLVEAALVKLGYLGKTYAGDGSFGSTTVTAYAKWQRHLGYTGKDADGIPGKSSLTALGKRAGFEVVA